MRASQLDPAPRTPATSIERLYALALRLYPAAFRKAYAPAMHQAFRDALADNSLPRRALIMLILRDLIKSLIKEYNAMLRNSLARPVLVFNALVLAGIATGVALALYAIPQHVLRSGLNDPQIQLAGDIAVRLEQGTTPADAVPSGQQIDMARSLSPFVIVYDDQGHAIASQGLLNGSVPTPPAGVFENVRKNGEERLSWQPVRGLGGVRIATVIERVNGPHPGYVLAGRNMREVESRIAEVQTMAGLTWLGMLALILVAAIAYAIYTRPGSDADSYRDTTRVAP
ncbi:MAG: hypothetical protein WBQ95_15255 [Terracidiphilus sp.]